MEDEGAEHPNMPSIQEAQHGGGGGGGGGETCVYSQSQYPPLLGLKIMNRCQPVCQVYPLCLGSGAGSGLNLLFGHRLFHGPLSSDHAFL